MRNHVCLALMTVLLVACGDDGDDSPPPPVSSAPVTAAPPGQVMLTVVANSSPQGAVVTGGGRQLGTTPLETRVPVPAPTPGQVQTFQFSFLLPGYQPVVISASPAHDTITVTAPLAPMTVARPVEVGGLPGQPVAPGTTLTILGRGGGAIYDNHTTTGTALVEHTCMIDRLRVRMSGSHTYYGDLRITLRDPEGHTYTLAHAGRRNPFRAHTVRRATGREARGEWRLSVADQQGQDSGVLRSWGLDITCR